MKNWWKWINPISFFKWLKRYMENKEQIEANLIDNEKQREHEKLLQENEFKHIAQENEKNRQFKLKIEKEKRKRLILHFQNEKENERKKLNEENNNCPKFILKMYRKGRKGKK